MKRKLTMIFAGLFLSIGMALAQTAVTGTVVSQDDGQPIIGASVRVIGADNVGTVTDADGKFSLTMPKGSTKLRVSYVGMETQDVTVKNGRVKVTLVSNQENLDEILVVAYGTAKKSAFTGSAAVVKSDDIEKISDSNALQALTGKVAGVQINSATGQPGQESFNIRVRGISSINAGNSPLIIVDGAPFDGDFNSINPGDIESMTVLKDAASAALYGARGANGVVIITTKAGKGGTSSITVDAKWGGNSRAVPDYKVVKSPAAYYEMYYQNLYNYATNTLGYSGSDAYKWTNNNMIDNASYGLQYNVFTVPEGQYLIGTDGKLNPNATLGRLITNNGNTYMLMPDDWSDATYKSGFRQEYTVTASGNNNNGSFYGSANYLKQGGIIPSSDYERFSGRLKADYQLRPWLKLSGNFTYAHLNSNYITGDGESGSSGSATALKNTAPIYSLYIRDANGNKVVDPATGKIMYDYGDGDVIGISRPYLSQSNPLSDLRYDTNNVEGNTFTAVGAAEIRFLKDFKFTSTNNVMVDEGRESDLTNPYYGQNANIGGSVSKYHTRTWSYNYQQLLNWHHLFGKHDLEAMIGHEYYRSRDYILYGYKTGIYSIYNTELSGAITDGTMDSYTSDYNTEGYFGRIQYNYDNKYFGSVSYRRDASSRFHPDHRWGNFWSAGAAWILSKEKWLSDVSWLDELKFKASYGEQGNDNIGNYLYTDTYTITNSDGNISFMPSSTKGNENITWEKSGNFNTGFEFSFFKGRLAGSIEYFYRKTSDMLAWFTLPASYGYTGYYDNIGNMVNTGVEVELNGTVIRVKDFEWGLNLNFTSYKNKITYMPDENKSALVDGVRGYASSNQYYGEGQPIYTWYLPKYAGVDPETGDALYYKDIIEYEYDANGNQVYDKYGIAKYNVVGQETTTNASEATTHLCGTALPKCYGGFGTTFEFKGFDLSADFTYQLGGKVYDSSYQNLMGAGGTGYAYHADLANAWTTENRYTNVPRLEYNYTYMATSSDRFLVSGSYLCLQNLNLGYTLPKNVVSKIGLTNLRVYVTGTNLWLWSKRQGLDPRQSITGSTSDSYYSPMRTISGGLTVTF
ncbi:MAG: TonB-dependent receptor [Prevotella sp.]|nr:TonB-dependent receptor [Prevotella sp.]